MRNEMVTEKVLI